MFLANIKLITISTFERRKRRRSEEEDKIKMKRKLSKLTGH